MKIEAGNPNQLKTLNTAQKTEAEHPADSAKSNPGRLKEEAFTIEISDKVKEMISATPDNDEIRLDKVAAIREQLAKGNYNISGKDVADKILNALKS